MSQRNSTCKALWRDRCRAGMLFAETRHLDGRHGGIVAFVAVPPAGARFSLLLCVGGEDSERHRQSGFERYLLQSSRRLARDVIKMRCVSANHRSQRDDSIISTALSELLRRQRQLKCAGYQELVKPIGLRAFEGIARAFQQLYGDRVIETG